MEFKRWLGERRPRNVLGLDTETTGLNPYAPDAAIRLIQFGDGEHGWAMSVGALATGWPGGAAGLGGRLDRAQHRLLRHPAGSRRTPPHRFERHRIRDGMIAAHIIDPLGPGALKPLSQRLVDPRAAAGRAPARTTGCRKNKWTWATVPVDFPPVLAVRRAGPGALLPARRAVRRPRSGRARRYGEIYDLEMAARHVVTAMQQRGARIDLDYVTRTGQAAGRLRRRDQSVGQGQLRDLDASEPGAGQALRGPGRDDHGVLGEDRRPSRSTSTRWNLPELPGAARGASSPRRCSTCAGPAGSSRPPTSTPGRVRRLYGPTATWCTPTSGPWPRAPRG